MKARTKAVFDEATCTISYVAAEPDGQHCAVIDSVMCAGRLPPPEANGISYLKIPVNAL